MAPKAEPTNQSQPEPNGQVYQKSAVTQGVLAREGDKCVSVLVVGGKSGVRSG